MVSFKTWLVSAGLAVVCIGAAFAQALPPEPNAPPPTMIPGGGGATPSPPAPPAPPSPPANAGSGSGIGMPPSPPIGPLTMEQNVDRPGQDYGYFPLQQANPDQCRIACQNDGRCSAYTYVHPGVQAQTAMCWLKASVPNPVQNACCISGKR